MGCAASTPAPLPPPVKHHKKKHHHHKKKKAATAVPAEDKKSSLEKVSEPEGDTEVKLAADGRPEMTEEQHARARRHWRIAKAAIMFTIPEGIMTEDDLNEVQTAEVIPECETIPAPEPAAPAEQDATPKRPISGTYAAMPSVITWMPPLSASNEAPAEEEVPAEEQEEVPAEETPAKEEAEGKDFGVDAAVGRKKHHKKKHHKAAAPPVI
eukprot:3417639-Rhodomonas_salina.4